jgi:hypothetical protein
MLAEKPFSSCKVPCRHFRIGKMTCSRIFPDKLSLKKFHLRWVTYGLLVNQKRERMSYSKLFLMTLMEHKLIDFEQATAGDESQFFLYCPHDSV